jgi:thiol-disulfide isomerase/thioredoxin
MKKLLLVLSCLMTLSLTTQNRFTTDTNWKDLFSLATTAHKMVIIDCYFEGCHPCKQMDDEVFPHPAISQLMDSAFVGVKTDILKEDFGKQLQIKYGITGFPTYLIFTSDGHLVDYFSGYKEADLFESLLRKAAGKARAGIVLNGFSNVPDVPYPEFYSAYFKERKSYSPQQLESYLTDNKKGLEFPFKEEAVMPLLMTRGLTSDLMDFVLKNYNQLEKSFGKGLVEVQLMRSLQNKFANGTGEDKELWLNTFLGHIKQYINDADWPYVTLNIAESYYVNYLKDLDAFFKFAATHFNDDDNKVRYMGMRLTGANATATQKDLYLSWATKVLNQHSAQDALEVAASVLLTENRKDEAGRLAGWALTKAKQNNRDPSGSQKILDQIHREN